MKQPITIIHSTPRKPGEAIPQETERAERQEIDKAKPGFFPKPKTITEKIKAHNALVKRMQAAGIKEDQPQ